MANKYIFILIIAGLFGLFSAAGLMAEEEPECDLPTIEEAYWCDHCVDTADNVISGYACGNCLFKTDDSEENKTCPKCQKSLTPAQWHRECGKVINGQKVPVCVKTGYICENDDAESFQPGECFTCETMMEKITVKSRVVYICKECNYLQKEAGTCRRNQDSPCYNKPLTKTCENSGLFPHIPAK